MNHAQSACGARKVASLTSTRAGSGTAKNDLLCGTPGEIDHDRVFEVGSGHKATIWLDPGIAARGATPDDRKGLNLADAEYMSHHGVSGLVKCNTSQERIWAIVCRCDGRHQIGNQHRALRVTGKAPRSL